MLPSATVPTLTWPSGKREEPIQRRRENLNVGQCLGPLAIEERIGLDLRKAAQGNETPGHTTSFQQRVRRRNEDSRRNETAGEGAFASREGFVFHPRKLNLVTLSSEGHAATAVLDDIYPSELGCGEHDLGQEAQG